MAYYTGQEFVKKQLKSPSTADFPSFKDIQHSHMGDCVHHLRAYVDSQNAFGAMLRTRFTLVVERSDGKVYLKSLEFDD